MTRVAPCRPLPPVPRADPPRRAATRAVTSTAVALALVLAGSVGCGSDADEGATGAQGPRASTTAPTDPSASTAVERCPVSADALAVAPVGRRVVVFTRTEGFRHPSIADAQRFLAAVGRDRGWDLVVTEDPAVVTAALVDRTRPAEVLVLANTTGDVFDDDHQRAVEAWVRAGGAVVAVHSATDTEYDWPFYGEIVGAWSAGHPPGLQTVELGVVDPDHPATDHLEDPWQLTEELYDFDRDPGVGGAEVLLDLDEDTAVYEPGARPFAMGEPHPVAWTRTVEAGRAFTTNLGHRPETWCDPDFQRHLLGGLAWAEGEG